jgi:DNA polymerase I-like protein with 3'-5' exonuclease and polymerase domains
VLADYLWRHFEADQYAQAIMKGKKEDETDIHNVNKKALAVPSGTRDMAKTFIYAWLLGAGVAKTGQILKVNMKEALAGILQNGEACLMKHSLLKWHDKARQEGINFKMVGFIHDEYQVEVIGTEEEAKRLGQIQADCMLETGQELGFKIPTPGSYDIGKNWAETH